MSIISKETNRIDCDSLGRTLMPSPTEGTPQKFAMVSIRGPYINAHKFWNQFQVNPFTESKETHIIDFDRL